jgi:hypothetical protein
MRAAAVALLVVASAAVYANSLTNPYVLDDIAAVSENRAAHWPPDLAGIFAKNYWGDRPGYESLTIYRPAATLTFALVDRVFGPDCPAAQRAVNIALHVGCTLVLFFLLAMFLRSVPAALAAALLFALHPVHTEAVVGVVSRAELMAAFFVLVGTLAWLGWRDRPVRRRTLRWVMPVILACALMSKESGFTLLGVVAGADGVAWMVRRRTGRREGSGPDWIAYGLMLAVFAAYMGLRLVVLPGVLAGDLSASDNPIVAADAVGRVLSPFKVLAWYLRLLVVPTGLTIDYSVNHFQVAADLADPAALAGVVAMLAALAACVASARREGVLAMLLLGFFATYSVVSNFAFLSTIVMAERLVYLPSAFFVAAVVHAARQAADRLVAGARDCPMRERWMRAAGWGLAVAVSGAFAVGTVERNADWESPLSLYSAAVATAPDSAKARHLLANELATGALLEDAVRHYSASLALDPSNFVARTNYAAALHRLGREDEALEELKVVLTRTPRYRPAFALVCTIYHDTGKPRAASKYCL